MPEEDERQTLFEEFLYALAEGVPSVFLLENVKGLLSARVSDRWIFAHMLRDLADPCAALGWESNSRRQRPRYRLFSLADGSELVPSGHQQAHLHGESGEVLLDGDPAAAVVRMERYGVPQARHRVLLLGVRTELAEKRSGLTPMLRNGECENRAGDVLSDLPALRSRVSRGRDSPTAWRGILEGARRKAWYRELADLESGAAIRNRIGRTLDRLSIPRAGAGAIVVHSGCGRRSGPIPSASRDPHLRSWYTSAVASDCFPNHEARSHMPSDLHRYLFVAAYGMEVERSPDLSDFPVSLLPDHGNVEQALEGGNFADRFRVQLAKRPATTVTSHIRKDGHYYVHYDPSQCRSLTVREAARLQTFPDDYVFLGNRTEQYRQVGNAVPPYLAAQVALLVHELLG